MGSSRKISYLLLVLFLFCPLQSRAQAPDLVKSVSESLITAESLERSVGFLSDSLCQGRGTGSRGGVEASAWIARRFRSISLDTRFQSFRTPDGKAGHNVIGFCPASAPSDRYIVVTAHYDGLGVLAGRYYPGADSNASGVAALVDLAHTMRSLSVLGRSCRANILFVALDAKQLNMAGSNALWQALEQGAFTNPVTGSPITSDQIALMVNLDIIGSSLEPVTKGRPDYLIMLSTDDLLKRRLSEANYGSRLYLNISFDYYRSPDFTDLFLNRLGDQRVFIEHGIPSVLFTSGITMNTNKTDDDASTLNYAVLKNRVVLISRWLSLQ